MSIRAVCAVALAIVACTNKPPHNAGPTRDIVPFVDTGGQGLPPGQEDYDHDGYVATEDCNNTDDAVHPEALEVCNGVDDDCDGLVDEGDGRYVDEDGDGFGGRLLMACDSPGALVTALNGGDCDDEEHLVYPGAPDPDCDQVDQDCDGLGAEAAQYGDGTSWPTVQAAIDGADSDEEIIVCTGRHTERLVVFSGTDIHIRSFDRDPSATFFDGEGAGRSLDLLGGHVVIEDLGFTNGYAYDENLETTAHGGAIYSDAASLEIYRAIFTDSFGEAGGAIFFGWDYSPPDLTEISLTVKDSVFGGNISSEGGADIGVSGSMDGRIDVLLEGNQFDGRYVSSQAGRVNITGTTPIAATLRENTFMDATAGMRGGCLDIGPYRNEGATAPPFEPILIQNSTFINCTTENDGGAISIGSMVSTEDPLPVIIDSCSFIDSHADVDGGTIYVSSRVSVDLTLSKLNIEGSSANGHGGAVYIAGDAPVTITVSDTTLKWSTANGNGGAIDIKGDGPVTLAVTDTIFDQHTSGGGGSAIAAIDEAPTTIRCERCTITGGQAGFEGGAVDIDNFATFDSIDSDWGSLSTNNSPNDLVIPDYLYRNLAEHETFSCSPYAGCTIDLH